jgi:CPA1 family monovalent cation:H+ antiporter
VTAYGAYLLADRLGGSGVIAVVVAGLLIANYGIESAMSASSRVSLTEFWEVLAFLANSALFLVIGLEFHIGDLRGRTLVATLVAIGAMLVGRAMIAFGLLWPFRGPSSNVVPASWRTAVFWGGLRGSIPIALVLGLQDRRFAGVDAVAVVFGVVFFSLVVQGLTYKPLLDRLGLTTQTDQESRYERVYAHTIALRAARRELASMRRSGELAESLYATYERRIGDDLDRYEQQLAELTRTETTVRRRQLGAARRRLGAAQRLALTDAARAGRITDAVAREVIGDIDDAAAEDTTERDGPPPPSDGPPPG